MQSTVTKRMIKSEIPKKLTKRQEEFVLAHGLNPEEWCFLKDFGDFCIVVRKDSGQKRWLDKFLEEE